VSYKAFHWVLLLWAATTGLLAAQERDPTVAPAGAFAEAAPSGAALKSAQPLADGAAVLVRDGKPYLVSGTRLYGLGQSLGAYKIERIGETEIWLRNGKELRKIQRFSGIVRSAATERPTP
jgi:hypothetical protein